MKIAILFKSITGNTRQVAGAIRDALTGQEIAAFGPPQAGVAADLYFIGSWTDKGLCDQEVLELLRTLRGRRIAYFGTAGFGGSPEYYEALYQRTAEQIDPSNRLVGHFYCQGRMPAGVRQRYEGLLREKPGDPKLLASLENFDRAASHPDGEDLARAGAWAREMLQA